MNIKENLEQVKNEIPETVKLVAVSKTKPVEIIQEAYDAGQRVFGENKAQEMSTKHEQLPKDIEWHFIGHMQTNKVKYIAPFVSLIPSVDSLKVLKEINKQAEKNNRVIDCLLQFHIAEEESKFGLSLEGAKELLQQPGLPAMEHVQIAGVMGMASFTSDQEQVTKEFALLKDIYSQLKEGYFKDTPTFKEISMGMSGDYRMALQDGSTMVRVGSAIFGARACAVNG